MQPEAALMEEPTSAMPLPPARTQWSPLQAGEEGAEPLGPFVPGRHGQGVGEVVVPEPAADVPEMEATMPWEEELPPLAEAAPEEEEESTDVDAWAATLPMETGRAAPPWEDEPGASPTVEETPATDADLSELLGTPPRDFPLDAFIIPEDSRRIPAGVELSEELQLQIAQEVAERLEAMAARLRETGLSALLAPSPEHEPVDVVMAAVLSGYISRRAH